jgi:hypothetical protein
MNDTAAATGEAVQETPQDYPFTAMMALIGVLFKPRATFRRMREAERGHWWVIAVIAAIVVVVSVIVQSSITSVVVADQMKENFDVNGDGELSETEQQQLDQSLAIANSPVIRFIFPAVFGVIGLFVSYLVRGGILYLLGMAVGGRAGFRQVFRMAVWTTLPAVLRNLISTIMVLPGGSSASGLSFIFTGEEVADLSPLLVAFLSGIDVYLIWSLVLIGVGLVATSQLSKAKGALVTVIYWLLTVAVTLGLVALGQVLGNTFGPG